MHNALIVLGLGSVILLSMGFLGLALAMSRQWTKDVTPRRPDDDA